MPDNNQNYNFNADQDMVKIIMLLVIGLTLIALVWKSPNNEIINIILTALTTAVVGIGIIKNKQ